MIEHTDKKQGLQQSLLNLNTIFLKLSNKLFFSFFFTFKVELSALKLRIKTREGLLRIVKVHTKTINVYKGTWSELLSGNVSI